MLYSHQRALGLLQFLVCRSQYNVMREPSLEATSYQCRRRYSSPRSREELFHVEQTAATSYRRPRQWNARGSPGSPRLIAAASNVPGTGSMASLTNSPRAGVTPAIRPRERAPMHPISEPPSTPRRPKRRAAVVSRRAKPSPTRFSLFALCLLVSAGLLAGCNSTALMVTQPDAGARAALTTRQSASPPVTTAIARRFEHVVVIVLENQDY